MNAREAISRRAVANGWTAPVVDEEGVIWARGEDRVVVGYKLYGGQGSMRMCKYYGKDPEEGINWGVKIAFHGDVEITGKNKKGQILKILSAKP